VRPDEINHLLREQPFQPFRILLSNGNSYDIRHPELVSVGRTRLFIGIPAAESPSYFDDWALVALVHINDVRPLPPSAPPSGNGAGQP
jgi:hypothetical protein